MPFGPDVSSDVASGLGANCTIALFAMKNITNELAVSRACTQLYYNSTSYAKRYFKIDES
jgi:hypothetical protein